MATISTTNCPPAPNIAAPASSSTTKCLVCSAPTNATHFGIESCRACSAFFKRTTLSGKQYICRQGKGDCAVDKDEKFTCRKCRFDKCVAVGLIYEGPLRIDKKRADSVPDLTPPSTSTESFLERVSREYMGSLDRRRAQELAMLAAKVEHPPKLEHPTEEIYVCDSDTIMRILNISVAEAWIFFQAAFPAVLKLSFAEQRAVCRNYMAKFSALDGLLKTMNTFGSYKEYSMCAVTAAVHMSDTSTWFDNLAYGQNRGAVIQSVNNYLSDQHGILLPAYEKARPTEFEQHALFALIAFDTEMEEGLSEAALAMLESLRADTLADLQRYYREQLGLVDYSTRLGNLMTVCHTIKESAANFQEYFRMQVTLFDTFTAESLIKDLFL